MVELPERGRVFRGRRRVRLGDAGRSGRLRWDACARYLQDIGNDDTEESGLDERVGLGAGIWVVRRAVVDVIEPPRWGEWLDLATWCSGTGGRWAGRRLAMTGDRGGRVDIDTLWVHLDRDSLMPARLPEAFMELYGEAAGGRKISAKHLLPGLPDEALERVPWPLRAVDYDVMNHVNNAAYWAAIEELGAPPWAGQPTRAVLEYGSGIAVDAPVELQVRREDKQVDVWFTIDGTVHATARLTPLS
ncbi:MAG: acyl-[acyl-carrier-protein] thioesterase [Acidimicrobiales bacterium]